MDVERRVRDGWVVIGEKQNLVRCCHKVGVMPETVYSEYHRDGCGSEMCR